MLYSTLMDNSFKYRLNTIIFGSNTTSGKWFDICLIFMISCSVLVVMLDSVESYRQSFGTLFTGLEWAFTIFLPSNIFTFVLFTTYAIYAKSFFGIVDILAILPTYLSLLLPGTHYLTVIRILRVLRILGSKICSIYR